MDTSTLPFSDYISSASKIHLVRFRIFSNLECMDASRGRYQFFCNQERSMLVHHTKKKIHENVNVNVLVSQAAGGSYNRRIKIAVYHVIQCEMKRSKKCKRQERMLLSYLQCGKLHLVHS